MLKNFGLTVISLVLAIAICEGIARVVGRDLVPRAEVYVFDPDVGKRLQPGWTGEEFGTHIQISSQGLRNRETPYAKPPGTLRILALGDSWTFGYRTEETESYPRQLEQILNERPANNENSRPVEVINAGVIGYSTEQEAAYLRVEGYRFEPDLILVGFYPVNDWHPKMEKYARYNRLREIHPLVLEAYLLPRKMYLRQYVKGARYALKERFAQLRSRFDDKTPDVASDKVSQHAASWTDAFTHADEGWQNAQKALIEIGERTRALGARGLVLLFPDLRDIGHYIEHQQPQVSPMVEDAVLAAGMEFYDLADDFRPYRGRETGVREANLRHPNPVGYRIIAEATARRIEDRGLLE